MPAPTEKDRLVKQLIEVVRVSGAPLPIHTRRDVEEMLARAREEMPGADSASDEDLLRSAIMHFMGDFRAALTGDEREIAELIDVGKELFYQKRFDEAREALLQCEELAVRLGDDHGNAWAKQYLGRIERDSGKLDDAMRLYEQALELAERIPDSKLVAVINDQIGTTFRLQGNLDRAEQHFRIAMATDPQNAPYAKANLAIVHQQRGQVKRASVLDEEARSEYQNEGNLRNEAMLCCNRADACLSRMDYRGAAKFALEAYHLAVATKYTQVATNADGIFALICNDLIGIPDGLAQFRKVLKLKWKPDEWQFRSQLLLNMFMFCVERELFNDAAETGWTFAKLAAAHQDTGVGRALREPLQKTRAALMPVAEQPTDQATGPEVAAATLALAQCQAALGENEDALRLAQRAGVLLEACQLPQGAAQQLCEELRSGGMQ
jgi:tetratricopeptide (TPR) repeat protein